MQNTSIAMIAEIFLKLLRQKKVQEFDFSLFGSDEGVTRFIQLAIDILKENLPQQFLLLDEVCNPEL